MTTTAEQLEQWRGRHVVDADGQDIGKLEDVYYSNGGEPVLARVSSGLLGRNRVLVPLADSSVSRDFLRVSFRKEQIDQAGTADVGDVIDANGAARVGQAYGIALSDSQFGLESSDRRATRGGRSRAGARRRARVAGVAARPARRIGSRGRQRRRVRRRAGRARRGRCAPGCHRRAFAGRSCGDAHQAAVGALTLSRRADRRFGLRPSGQPLTMGSAAFDEWARAIGDLSRAPLVRVEPGLGRPERPITAVFLHGEHDYGSRALVDEALGSIHSDALVDLSWCTFVDSSIISLILAKHAALEREGCQLEVILPPTHTHLSRTFDRLGARQLMPVRDAPPPARPGDA